MPNRIIPYNPALKALARKLRTQSTFGEILLWTRIRRKALGVEFHRQLPIDNYIVDFYCHELFLAIEIDGSHKDEAVAENDVRRQASLENLGVRFIRFTGQDVRHKMPEVLAKLSGMIEHLQRLKQRDGAGGSRSPFAHALTRAQGENRGSRTKAVLRRV